jgi:hypothetical protein
MAARHPPCRAAETKGKRLQSDRPRRDVCPRHGKGRDVLSDGPPTDVLAAIDDAALRAQPKWHPISTAFRFRSGAKDPERTTLRDAVINWPDGDEGEKSHFRDGSNTSEIYCPRYVRSSPDIDRRTDIAECLNVPIGDSCAAANSSLFDHLVGTQNAHQRGTLVSIWYEFASARMRPT